MFNLSYSDSGKLKIFLGYAAKRSILHFTLYGFWRCLLKILRWYNCTVCVFGSRLDIVALLSPACRASVANTGLRPNFWRPYGLGLSKRMLGMGIDRFFFAFFFFLFFFFFFWPGWLNQSVGFREAKAGRLFPCPDFVCSSPSRRAAKNSAGAPPDQPPKLCRRETNKATISKRLPKMRTLHRGTSEGSSTSTAKTHRA